MIESPNLALDKIDNCEELYFSGNMISAKNTITVDNIRLATANLNNIKIGANVNKHKVLQKVLLKNQLVMK